jgi:hypothetical protein
MPLSGVAKSEKAAIARGLFLLQLWTVAYARPACFITSAA